MVSVTPLSGTNWARSVIRSSRSERCSRSASTVPALGEATITRPATVTASRPTSRRSRGRPDPPRECVTRSTSRAAPSGTSPASSSAFSFGVTETLWWSRATTRPPYASCSAVMVRAGQAAERAVGGGERAVHEHERAALAQPGPVGVGERVGHGRAVAVDGHPAHPVQPVLGLPALGEVVADLAEDRVDEREHQDLEDLLADRSEDAARLGGLAFVDGDDGARDPVRPPLTAPVGRGRGRDVVGEVPGQRAVLGGVQEHLPVALARCRDVDDDVVAAAAAARALTGRDLLVPRDDDGELLGHAGVVERLAEVLGGLLLAPHAGRAGRVHLDLTGEAGGGDHDLPDGDGDAFGSQLFGHGALSLELDRVSRRRGCPKTW